MHDPSVLDGLWVFCGPVCLCVSVSVCECKVVEAKAAEDEDELPLVFKFIESTYITIFSNIAHPVCTAFFLLSSSYLLVLQKCAPCRFSTD